MAEEVPI